MMASEAKPQFLSIPLTADEIQVINRYRQIRPGGAMKVSKNLEGTQVNITMETHERLRVEHNLPPAYGTMNP